MQADRVCEPHTLAAATGAHACVVSSTRSFMISSSGQPLPYRRSWRSALDPAARRDEGADHPVAVGLVRDRLLDDRGLDRICRQGNMGSALKRRRSLTVNSGLSEAANPHGYGVGRARGTKTAPRASLPAKCPFCSSPPKRGGLGPNLPQVCRLRCRIGSLLPVGKLPPTLRADPMFLAATGRSRICRSFPPG